VGRKGRARRAARTMRRSVRRTVEVRQELEHKRSLLAEAEDALSVGGESMLAIIDERDRLRVQVGQFVEHAFNLDGKLQSSESKCKALKDNLHEQGVELETYKDDLLRALGELDRTTAAFEALDRLALDLRRVSHTRGETIERYKEKLTQTQDDLLIAHNECRELKRERDAVRTYMRGGIDDD
jgi:chromosome segregation ATPase